MIDCDFCFYNFNVNFGIDNVIVFILAHFFFILHIYNVMNTKTHKCLKKKYNEKLYI